MKTDNYDNEETRLEGAQNATGSQASASDDKSKSKGGAWKSAAAGAASGVVIGTLSTTLMGMKSAGDEPQQPADNHKEELSHPEWVDDQVQVATSVSDDMSFGQAFAAARAEVGAGGCFEWHGKLYGTYTAEEWNSMSAEERAEYGDHFSWNHIDHSSGNVAQSSHTSAPANQSAAADTVSESVTDHTSRPVSASEPDVTVSAPADSPSDDIEVLGYDRVAADDGSFRDIAVVSSGGNEIAFVDTDLDGEADFIMCDANCNQVVDDGELVNVSGEGISMRPLQDAAGFDPLFAQNDLPDYVNDADVNSFMA